MFDKRIKLCYNKSTKSGTAGSKPFLITLDD